MGLKGMGMDGKRLTGMGRDGKVCWMEKDDRGWDGKGWEGTARDG